MRPFWSAAGRPAQRAGGWFKDFLPGQTDLFMSCRVKKEDLKKTPLAPRGTHATSSSRSTRSSGRCCTTAPRRCWRAPRPLPAATSALTVSRGASAPSCAALCCPILLSSSRWPTTTYIRREVIALFKRYGSKAEVILDEVDFSAPAEECEYFLLSLHLPHAQSHASQSTSTFTCAEGTPRGRGGCTCTFCVV
jgi:hypothetical protein